MRDRKFILSVLAFTLFAGGCIVEPLEPDSDEEIDSISAGVSVSANDMGDIEDP